MATDETVIDIPALEAERDALLVIAGLLRLTHTGLPPEDDWPGTVPDLIHKLLELTSDIDLQKLSPPIFNELREVVAYAVHVSTQQGGTHYQGVVGHA